MGVVWVDDTLAPYDTASGTVTFNDSDVAKVFIDWGDGSNQTLDDGIYEWKDLDGTKTTASISHIYTKAGTYNVLVRTVNSDGILSKYYGTGAAAPTGVYPYEQNTSIAPLTITDGKPTSILRVENKNVFSGIDNNIFNEGPKNVYIQVAPLLSTSIDNTLKTKTLKLKVEAVEAIRNDQVLDTGFESVTTTIEKTFTLNSRATGDTDAIQLNNSKRPLLSINKVTLVSSKMTEEVSDAVINDFNMVKIFLIAQTNASTLLNPEFFPITYVSNGDPVKSLKDITRSVTLDFSQSRAKASNKLPTSYTYDNGKTFFAPTLQWQASSSTAFTDATKTGDTLIKEQYTYYPKPKGLTDTSAVDGSGTIALVSGNNFLYGATDGFIRDQFLLNEFNQFYDSYHLVRMTTTTNSNQTDDVNTFKAAYRIQPPYLSKGVNPGDNSAYYVNSVAVATEITSPSTNTKDYTTNAAYNKVGYECSTSGWNSGSFTDREGNPREASEYIYLGRGSKFGKVFFNVSPYAENLMTNLSGMNGVTVKGVYYLRVYNDKYNDKFTQNAEWVPLEFEDKTRVQKVYRNTGSDTYTTKSTSLAQSGYISFDSPSDWSKISMSDLCGGFYNLSGQAASVSRVTNDYSKGLENFVVREAASGNIYRWVNLSGTGIDTALLDEGYTDDDIGQYKYMFQVSSTNSDSSKSFWVASSSLAHKTLHIASGANIDGITKGFIRRVNIYDMFDGVSKVLGKGSNGGKMPQGDHVDGGVDSYPFQFMFGAPAPTPDTRPITPAQVSGNVNNIYPLKIVLSGNSMKQAQAKVHTELWNLLPADNSASQIIKQTDKTAYDLNYMGVTSDVSINFAGTFYQAISKNGNVYIVRTGTPIQTITLNGKAMGDETSFSYSNDYTSFAILKKIRDAQAEKIRVMWDEQQKDGTWVRYFGYITGVSETHSVAGKRAPRNFVATMVVEEICLMNGNGDLISDVMPLGGVANARHFT